MSEAAAKSEAAADGDGAEKAGTSVSTPAGPAASNPVSPKTSKGEDGATIDAKSDSEAETVVLPGKDDATASPRRKAIKHEGNDRSSKRVSEGTANKKKDTPDRNGENKEKKAAKEANHTATSSNLSSTRSSPVPEPRISSRAASESLQSKGKGQADSDSVSRASHSRKRKMASEETDEKSHKRRQKRDASLERAAGSKAADGDRREKSKSNPARSESPQPRTRNRAQSIKGSITSTSQRRKKPPPLSVGSRTKNNDDDSGSDGSTSPRGSHLKRLVSGDATATSPAKMPSHKKLLDRNGRTWLARACDSEDPQIVRDRLQERPEELDIADYAQNTPLQIASLKGRHEIVKVLLDAGCKLDVKNIDQDTPLIDAVENGHLKVIKLLLAAGVNPRQSNAEGEDVMDLLDPEGDDYDELKKLLTKARETRRRTSDDPQALTTGKESAHNHSPRETSLNSPPPLPTGSRRRTARSEATRNDLLWVNATSQNLQNKARVGDDAAVDHILNMNPGCADIYSVLAATRGSHEVSLSLILAIGRPSPDPDPIPGERGSQSTPMLAAIGRGNLRVIELLLEQPGFDPTRRLYQNKPYYEISKDRRGPQWDEEYRALKRAYDKAKGRPATASSPSSTKKTKVEKAGSPSQERTKSQADARDASKDVAVRKKSTNDGKGSGTRTDEKSPERSRQHTKKHLRVPSKPSSREASIAVSDREASPMRKSSEKKSRRSLSEAEEVEEKKPRKRLMSRRDLAEGSRQRRESMASVGSASSKDDTRARLARQQSGSQKVKREESRSESKQSKADAGKKRPRPETTSPEEKTRENSQTSPDAAKKAKRFRVDADGKPRKKEEVDGATSRHKSPGKDVASTAVNSGKTKDGKKASKDLKASSRTASPAPGSTGTTAVAKIKEEEPDDPSSQLQKEAQEAAEAAKKDTAAKKEADRAAREEAAAKEAEARKREEAERKLKVEKEEAERKAKVEKEDAERKAREEEEARAEKKRQEEERARQLAERERLRKEQEELQVRRRKEQEEKERLAREKKQQEEERRRRELLPNALRIAAELGPEQAKQPDEVRYWLPLYTAEGHQVDSNADDASKRELWVTNLQAAPVLGLTDLDLSQYTAWNKRSANDAQRLALWRILRRKLARYQPPEHGPADHQEEFRLDAEAHEKFDALKNIFWIRLSDLLDIVPRYPHLASIDLKCCPIAIRPSPKIEPGTQISPTAVPNGLPSRSSLPNGYH